MRTPLSITLLLLLTGLAPAQDKVKYRDRSGKGGESLASGKVEAESVAGLKVGAKTIASGDILDVQYEVTGDLRLAYGRALGEEAKNPANAVKEYEAMLKSPVVQERKPLKRHFEYKIATIIANRAEDSVEATQRAVEALSKFRKDHPDAWQVVPVTRLLGRMLAAKQPPDLDGARKAYEDLAATKDAPAEVKQECMYLVIDMLLQAGRTEEAQARLKSLPPTDPRAKLYQIGAQAGEPEAIVKQLEEFIDKTPDASLKAAAYNMTGDVLSRDPKFKKDALYAYLKVDLIYNQDAVEAQKAAQRIADLFQELRDEDRAKKYREKARGK
ncbi:MAG: hypothetical protein U0746_18630 [Gemmataceae bacterium]